ADQVSQRVAILRSVEPADRDAARDGLFGIEAEAAGLNPLLQGQLLGRCWLRLVRWRHDVRPCVAQNLQPELRVAQDLVVRRERVKLNARLLRAIAMTFIASTFQNGRNDFLKFAERLRLARCD